MIIWCRLLTCAGHDFPNINIKNISLWVFQVCAYGFVMDDKGMNATSYRMMHIRVDLDVQTQGHLTFCTFIFITATKTFGIKIALLSSLSLINPLIYKFVRYGCVCGWLCVSRCNVTLWRIKGSETSISRCWRAANELTSHTQKNSQAFQIELLKWSNVLAGVSHSLTWCPCTLDN